MPSAEGNMVSEENEAALDTVEQLSPGLYSRMGTNI